MVIELLRFEAGETSTNYFFTDPWMPPLPATRRRRGRVANCEFCSKLRNLKAMEEVWADALERSA